MNRIAIGLAICMASGTGAVRAQEPAAESVVLRAARLIDGTGGAAIENAAVVVQGNRILSVGPSARVDVPAGARVIDLGDATLLPGFIDAHTHITGRTLGDPRGDDASVRDLPGFAAILGVANAEKTLLAGFTSIRNLGSRALPTVRKKCALRCAIR